MENGKKAAFAAASEVWHQLGLTKREYFAGLAMQSCLSNGKGSNAEDWLRLADDLLAELEKTKEE